MDGAQIRTAYEILGPRLVSVRNRFSPAHLSTRDTLGPCTELGLAFLPWSPLGGISRSAVDDPDAAGPAPDTPFHSPARTRVSARSRPAWPGSWPSHRSWSRCRAPAGRPPSATPPGRRASTSDRCRPPRTGVRARRVRRAARRPASGGRASADGCLRGCGRRRGCRA
ncbi:hypothetical protein ACFTZH_25965 [Streptomyces fimicarius]|uniref:hypothetical protein n=1 Tax=Streptomyces griseus TaxID=1911 RepID=UPI00362AD168